MTSLGIQMTQINLHHSKSPSAILARSMAVMQLSSKDLTVIKVRVKLAEEEDIEVLIGSVYMPYDSTDPPPHEKIKTLVACAKARGLELLGCDANSHYKKRADILGLQKTRSHRYYGMYREGGEFGERLESKPSGSDHRHIRLTLQQIPQISWVRNPRKTNWEGCRADLKAQLAMAPTSFRTKNNSENAADFLKNAITNAFELNCSPKPRNPMNKIHWWNKELGKLSIESVPEEFRLHRILSLDHCPQLGCLKLPTENVTEEATDTLKHLMEVYFPSFDHNIQPCRPKPREYKPKDWRLAAEVVLPKGVEWAVKTFSPYKSPGPDGIYPVLLQEELGVLTGGSGALKT
ncbi:uncharacterized protein LOC109861288 [Pseudomyrmex gracilis]|uniref:uncharacterized protein LOC109861288 n=1 Tax=Pseudomyrmex gracilis TaxID=219809 RepID=UPI000995CEBD|nr:uncharacterized protein LOC109861288 [Pseudomyrmex gracilis]